MAEVQHLLLHGEEPMCACSLFTRLGCVNHPAGGCMARGWPSPAPRCAVPCPLHSHDARGGGEDVVNWVSFLRFGDSVGTQLSY